MPIVKFTGFTPPDSQTSDTISDITHVQLLHLPSVVRANDTNGQQSSTSLSASSTFEPTSSITDIAMPTTHDDDDDWGDSSDGLRFDTPEYRAKLQSLQQSAKLTHDPTAGVREKHLSLVNSATPSNSSHVTKTPRNPYSTHWIESLPLDQVAETIVQKSTILTQKMSDTSDHEKSLMSPDFSFHVDKFSASLPSKSPTILDGPHQFDRDYLAQVPKDQIEIWMTKIEFNVPNNETMQEGIKRRLLSFIPTAIAKSKGNILPWGQDSDLNPIRDLHVVFKTDLLTQYFKYDLIQHSRRVRGWMRFQVHSFGHSLNYIKHEVDIVKTALRSYPIYWSQSELRSTEISTPLFLAGVSKT